MRVVALSDGTIHSLAVELRDSVPRLGLRDPEPIGISRLAPGTLLATYILDSIVGCLEGTTGVMTTVAGIGNPGYSGDGGAAIDAELNFPVAAIIGRRGDLFIADSNNYVVRRVDGNSGVITTIAGTGVAGYAGDGGPAIEACLGELSALAVNAKHDLYIADLENCAVRRIDGDTRIISTIVGTGQPGYSGDGGPAVEAALNHPAAIVFDGQENLYIADSANSVVRRIDAATGVITTVAGTGARGFAGDAGPARNAELNEPCGLAVNGTGDLFIADLQNCRVRRVDNRTGTMTTVAGTGDPGHAGDGGPAIDAELAYPASLVIDGERLFLTEA